jgi:hypothetical protein
LPNHRELIGVHLHPRPHAALDAAAQQESSHPLCQYGVLSVFHKIAQNVTTGVSTESSYSPKMLPRFFKIAAIR